MTDNNLPISLTQRDGYIIAEALASAIALYAHMPAHLQDPSNNHDRRTILRALCPNGRDQSYLDRAAERLAQMRDQIEHDAIDAKS